MADLLRNRGRFASEWVADLARNTQSITYSVRPDGFTFHVHHFVSPRELADFYRRVRKHFGFKHQRERDKFDELNSKSISQQKRREKEKLLKPGVNRIPLLDKWFGGNARKTSALTTDIATRKFSRSTLYRHAKAGKIQKIKTPRGGVRWRFEPPGSQKK